MPEKRVALLIRIAPKLKQELADIAKREHRSINQEIEFLLVRAIQDISAREAQELKASPTHQSRRKSS